MLLLESTDIADVEASGEVIVVVGEAWLEVAGRVTEDAAEDTTVLAAATLEDVAESIADDEEVATDDGAALEDASVAPDLEMVIEELPLPEMPSVAMIW